MPNSFGANARSLQLSCLSQTVVLGDFTDGGGTSGYVDLNKKLPKGAIVLGWVTKVVTGFAGDTTADVQIGTTSDVDAYQGSNDPSVLSDDSVVAAVSPSNDTTGAKCVATSETTVRVTVTGGSDFGAITAGKLEVYVYYIDGLPEEI